MVFYILSVVKTVSGLFVVTVSLDGKAYEYFLQSEFVVRKAQVLCRKGGSGKALNLLKRFSFKKIKEGHDGVR